MPEAGVSIIGARPFSWGGASLRERIWFTKVNLRLRSTTLVDADGTPRLASFCSEIRRVTAPQD